MLDFSTRNIDKDVCEVMGMLGLECATLAAQKAWARAFVIGTLGSWRAPRALNHDETLRIGSRFSEILVLARAPGSWTVCAEARMRKAVHE